MQSVKVYGCLRAYLISAVELDGRAWYYDVGLLSPSIGFQTQVISTGVVEATGHASHSGRSVSASSSAGRP